MNSQIIALRAGLCREGDATLCQMNAVGTVAYAHFGALRMRRASELRDRAAGYVALAITARRNGDVRLAGVSMDRAADLMEEAVNLSPHLRELYLGKLTLWRRGVTM